MSDITIHGFSASTYTRTARLAAEEKGLAYRLADPEMGTDGYLKLRPFGKMPAMSHGEVRLFETFAITRYFDEAFDGPALQPADAGQRAHMTQWVSANVDYMYPTIVIGLIVPRLLYPQRDVAVDKEALKENLPAIDNQLAIAEDVLGSSPYLAGAEASIADFFVTPMNACLPAMPESKAALAKCPNIQAWQERMSGRGSFAATQPQLAA